MLQYKFVNVFYVLVIIPDIQFSSGVCLIGKYMNKHFNTLKNILKYSCRSHCLRTACADYIPTIVPAFSVASSFTTERGYH